MFQQYANKQSINKPTYTCKKNIYKTKTQKLIQIIQEKRQKKQETRNKKLPNN